MKTYRYIKRLKMAVLSEIAFANNVYDIVTELTEYARDVHPGIARDAVKAVGRIALQVKKTRVKWGIAIDCSEAVKAVGRTALQVKETRVMRVSLWNNNREGKRS